ncbi:hypothetical protein HELRODRAFT_165235 [Helobdella robusta]|uniref:Uncharacterized protein n=1 Tax=Helobdella robusta TaxID=6412 RepID=T1EWH3_HELRO|nr:hypothetical protein HELRODRAFT_165235 [Helobdella robusta]ESN93076.1 hypothetical protein HELRODRAFT_165235 [Helobdella robusta]
MHACMLRVSCHVLMPSEKPIPSKILLSFGVTPATTEVVAWANLPEITCFDCRGSSYYKHGCNDPINVTDPVVLKCNGRFCYTIKLMTGKVIRTCAWWLNGTNQCTEYRDSWTCHCRENHCNWRNINAAVKCPSKKREDLEDVFCKINIFNKLLGIFSNFVRILSITYIGMYGRQDSTMVEAAWSYFAVIAFECRDRHVLFVMCICITFHDNVPKMGYACISLCIPELKLTRSRLRYSKRVPDNIDINCKFTKQSIDVKVTIDNVMEKFIYNYYRPTPEDLDESKSNFKAENGKIILEIAKVGGISWVPHARYFVENQEWDKNTKEFSESSDTSTEMSATGSCK